MKDIQKFLLTGVQSCNIAEDLNYFFCRRAPAWMTFNSENLLLLRTFHIENGKNKMTKKMA